MVAFTANFRLTKPDFNSEGWDTQLNSDLDVIDSVLGQFNTGLTIQGVWLNATLYPAGVSVIDGLTGHIWLNSTTHTSPSSPTTFASERASFPTYWSDITNPAISAAVSATNAAASAVSAAASLASITAVFSGGTTGTGRAVLDTSPTIVSGTFSTTVVLTGVVSGAGIVNYFASPPPFGSTAPADVHAVALSATGLFTPASAIGVKGTIAGDNAQAGSIGEHMESNSGNNSATCTITIATPAVITKTAHSLLGIAPVFFTTTGALPTGLVAGTTYWTIPGSITANTFQLATSIANAIAGTAIATSGTQSGVQTCTEATILSTGVNANIAALSLTPGDWDVTGNATFNVSGGTTITQLTATAGLVSATIPSGSGSGATVVLSPSSAANAANTLSLGTLRVNVTVTTIVYLVVQAGFAVSNMTALGHFRARRMR